MQKVRTVEEAVDFFLEQEEDTVIAINKDGEEKIVSTYPDAEEHIESKKI